MDISTRLSEFNQAATKVESKLNDIAIQSIGPDNSAIDHIKLQIASVQRKIGGNGQIVRYCISFYHWL